MVGSTLLVHFSSDAMLRLIGSAVLALHGLIQLLGIRSQLTRSATAASTDTVLQKWPLLPAGWVVAALLLGTAAVGVWLRKPWWWAVAAAGILVSQALIIAQWREAWAGTILNIAIGLAVLTGAGFFISTRRVRAEAQALANSSRIGSEPFVITAKQLNRLPAPARRYLTYAGIVGHPMVQTVTVHQTGQIRTKLDQPWMAMTAEQYFTVRPASFIWLATMHKAGVPFLQVCDRYVAAHGSTQVRPAALLTVSNAQGPKMDQGALQRFIAEAVWFPMAYLQNNVTIEPVDEQFFRVTLMEADQRATITLHVDTEGKLTEVTARRYREVNGAFELSNWSVQVTEYGEFQRLRVPKKVRIVWRLPEGDFEPINLTVTKLRYSFGGFSHASQLTKSMHKSSSAVLQHPFSINLTASYGFRPFHSIIKYKSLY